MCLTVFLHNLSPSPLWSTTKSGILLFILHTFLHPIIVFLLQYMSIPSQPVLHACVHSCMCVCTGHLFYKIVNVIIKTLLCKQEVTLHVICEVMREQQVTENIKTVKIGTNIYKLVKNRDPEFSTQPNQLTEIYYKKLSRCRETVQHTHTTVLRLCGICPGKPG